MDEFIPGIFSGIVQTCVGYPFDTIKTWRQGNVGYSITVRNLYRGMTYPLLQNTIQVSTVLYTNHLIKKLTNDVYVSSFTSGLISSLIICPLETFKIYEQQHIKYILTGKEFIRTYRNIGWCICREIPGNMIYFISYDTMKKHDLPIFYSGGIAGLLSWVIVHPLDTIKTRMQSGNYTLKAALRTSLMPGILASSIRGFIVNSIGLSVYEYTKPTASGYNI